MEDPDPTVRDMCARWWRGRDVWADQALFRRGGRLHAPKQHNAARCWVWQIRQFLGTTFRYTDPVEGHERRFAPRELPPELRRRLVAQLGCHLGILHGHWLPFLDLAEAGV